MKIQRLKSKIQKVYAGFTLVELLVAISIIAVLTAILLPNFMGARERAMDAKKKQDLSSMKNALRSYYNDNQYYPVTPVGSWWNNHDSSGIGSTISQYMPGAAGVGYTYYYQGTSDGFFLRVPTALTNVSDNGDSQLNCGIAVGSTDPQYFYVCAN